jgi:opacity protein-like surface antigen
VKRAFAAALAVAALVASALVAHASSLTVNAGYLQTLSVKADIEVPQDPTTYAVTLYLFFYNGSNHVSGHDKTLEFAVPVGGSYTLAWTGQSLDSSTCPSNPPTPPASPVFQGLGTFTPPGSGDHILCLDGANNWNSNTAKSDFVDVDVTAAETGSASIGVGSPSAAPSLSEQVLTQDPARVESETAASTDVEKPDDIPDFVGENCRDGGWQQLAAADGQPYADEQACVDDQVRAYYAQQREGGS